MSQELDTILVDIIKKLDVKVEEHKKTMDSDKYLQEKKYIDSIIDDFIIGMKIAFIYSIRYPENCNKLLINRGIEELAESIVSISLTFKEGVLNPPKRELRYMLEMAIKYLYVDSIIPGSSYEEKIQFLKDDVPRSSIEPIEKISLFGFNEEKSKYFSDDVNVLYTELCKFVHPSKDQLDEYFYRSKRGATLGFETAKELVSMGALLFRVLDILLVLVFQGLGPTTTGDMFIHMLDDIPKWKFHKGKHCKIVSSLFNYKAERKKHRLNNTLNTK
jgi:hypothetical protein